MFSFALFWFALFWFGLALTIAAVEVESEGKYGWAQKAPTWYRTTGVVAKIYGICMNGKPLTGYHSFMFLLPVLIFHAGFFMDAPWSLSAEMGTWALLLAWCSLWDYLWFVLNPAYGVKHFRRENVWWHAQSRWLFHRLPLDYLVSWLISVVLTMFAGQAFFEKHLAVLAYFVIFTALTIGLSPFYHRWRLKMLSQDDRNLAKIFHRL